MYCRAPTQLGGSCSRMIHGRSKYCWQHRGGSKIKTRRNQRGGGKFTFTTKLNLVDNCEEKLQEDEWDEDKEILKERLEKNLRKLFKTHLFILDESRIRKITDQVQAELDNWSQRELTSKIMLSRQLRDYLLVDRETLEKIMNQFIKELDLEKWQRKGVNLRNRIIKEFEDALRGHLFISDDQQKKQTIDQIMNQIKIKFSNPFKSDDPCTITIQTETYIPQNVRLNYAFLSDMKETIKHNYESGTGQKVLNADLRM